MIPWFRYLKNKILRWYRTPLKMRLIQYKPNITNYTVNDIHTRSLNVPIDRFITNVEFIDALKNGYHQR